MTASPARRIRRLRTPAQFRRVYTEGRLFRGPGLDLRVTAPVGAPAVGDPTPPARLGIAIRRTAVRTSVGRNRWKRWIREILRAHAALVSAGGDLVISVHQPPATWTYQRAETALAGLLQQAQKATRS